MHAKYLRLRYKNDPVYREKHKALVAKNNRRRYVEAGRVIREAKASGCFLCPEKETCCLSFHHMEAKQKEDNISDMRRRGLSIKRIKEELKKCICLCENCHRKVHAGILSA